MGGMMDGMGGMMGGGGLMGQGTGAAGLDLQMHKLPIVGPMLFQDPNDYHQRQQFHLASANVGQYRPEMANAYLNAMRNTQSIYQPTQDFLQRNSRFYGPYAGANMGQVYTNPMSPRMQMLGNPRDEQPQTPTNALGSMFGGL